jgi:hypothetical protein
MQVELQVLQALLVLTAHQQQVVVVEQVEVQMVLLVLRVARLFLNIWNFRFKRCFWSRRWYIWNIWLIRDYGFIGFSRCVWFKRYIYRHFWSEWYIGFFGNEW